MHANATVRQRMAAAKTQRKASAASVPASTAPADIPRVTGAPASTIAPKAETMNVEPSARKKFIVPVATPSWWSATAFCTTTTVNGNVGPTPSPTSAIRPSAAAGENPVGASASGMSAATESSRLTSGTSL